MPDFPAYNWMYKSAELNEYRFFGEVRLCGLFHTSLLISVTLVLCLLGQKSVIKESFVNMSTIGCRETVSFDFNVLAKRPSSVILSEQMFCIHCYLSHLFCISMD